MKSNITIEVEFLAGTDIKEAVQEAKEKANAWNISYVRFSFNGTPFSVGKNADIDKTVEEWNDKKFSKYGIVAN